MAGQRPPAAVQEADNPGPLAVGLEHVEILRRAVAKGHAGEEFPFDQFQLGLQFFGRLFENGQSGGRVFFVALDRIAHRCHPPDQIGCQGCWWPRYFQSAKAGPSGGVTLLKSLPQALVVVFPLVELAARRRNRCRWQSMRKWTAPRPMGDPLIPAGRDPFQVAAAFFPLLAGPLGVIFQGDGRDHAGKQPSAVRNVHAEILGQSLGIPVGRRQLVPGGRQHVELVHGLMEDQLPRKILRRLNKGVGPLRRQRK